MTSYPIAAFLVAALAWGQDNGTERPKSAQPKNDAVQPKAVPPKAETTPPQPAKPAETAVLHRLDSVTWNPATKELSWVVSVWDLEGNLEKPLARQAYAVRVDTATMNSNGETRGFDSEEARQVKLVMDMISAYAVGSTVWWEHGMGEKTECPKPEKGTTDNKGVPEKGTDGKTKPAAQPAPVVLPGPIASARPPQAAHAR